jgi:rSAM/selenodomain-associated transferase 2
MTTLSVIIPTLGEAATLPTLLAALHDQGFDDIIVADASTSTATSQVAIAAGARCLPNLKRGRGAQLHTGAAVALGEILFFLHADSVLPPLARGAIEACMTNTDVVAGSFRLAFDRRHPLLTLYAALSRLNWPIATYGDQGLFVRREVYEKIGGFADMALLEDLEIQTRLRRTGRFVKLPLQIVTSARRFVRRGILVQQVLNVVIVIAYLLGISPKRLARWYEGRPPSSL